MLGTRYTVFFAVSLSFHGVFYLVMVAMTLVMTLALTSAYCGALLKYGDTQGETCLSCDSIT